MANKRDELIQDENTGGGILGALGMAAVGIIGAVIAGANNERVMQGQRDRRKVEIQAEIEDLKVRRRQYENEFMGKLLYSDEIDAINSQISRLTNELRAL